MLNLCLCLLFWRFVVELLKLLGLDFDELLWNCLSLGVGFDDSLGLCLGFDFMILWHCCLV